jgi:hypothetical protein
MVLSNPNLPYHILPASAAIGHYCNYTLYPNCESDAYGMEVGDVTRIVGGKRERREKPSISKRTWQK